tara:strand:+ start:1055 stop:1246 length:192 start_codon:yes stop_codon:yes gene_type:complete
LVKNIINPAKVKQQKIREPTDPETVLLGLIFEILGPLNILPKTKPPISDAEQLIKRENKITFK